MKVLKTYRMKYNTLCKKFYAFYVKALCDLKLLRRECYHSCINTKYNVYLVKLIHSVRIKVLNYIKRLKWFYFYFMSGLNVF